MAILKCCLNQAVLSQKSYCERIYRIGILRSKPGLGLCCLRMRDLMPGTIYTSTRNLSCLCSRPTFFLLNAFKRVFFSLLISASRKAGWMSPHIDATQELLSRPCSAKVQAMRSSRLANEAHVQRSSALSSFSGLLLQVRTDGKVSCLN